MRSLECSASVRSGARERENEKVGFGQVVRTCLLQHSAYEEKSVVLMSSLPHPPPGSQPNKGVPGRTGTNGRHAAAGASAPARAAPRVASVSLRVLAAAGTATAAAAALMLQAGPVHAGTFLAKAICWKTHVVVVDAGRDGDATNRSCVR